MGSNLKTWVVILIIVLFVYIAGIGAWIGAKTRNEAILQFTLVMANILMASVVTIQALVTAEATEEAKKQAELMNESLLEMKKQRLNIEEFKNSLITYLRYIGGILKSNSTLTNYTRIEEPYQYIIKRYHERTGANLSPSEAGLAWRISAFIRRFLEVHGFSWQELDNYHDLIRKFKDSNTPRNEKSKLANEIREKSKELGKIVENILQEIEEMGNQKFEEEIMKILES